MTYPTNITLYPIKIDKNASGVAVAGEYFNIPVASPYQMYLDHVPKDTATTQIYASGGAEWTEDLTGTPSAGEFYINYSTGSALFNAANTGAALEARYETLGDDIMSDHINNMQDEVYGTETELGLGCKGAYATVAERLDTFINTGDSVSASNVSMSTPPGLVATTVQAFIDISGTADRSDTNPFGIGWKDIHNTVGDISIASLNIIGGHITGDTLSASGVQLGMNINGPDADQWMYFYDTGVANGQWFKWDNGDSRFELSTSTFFHGDITASGNIYPEASGSRNVGSPALAFGTGHFDTLIVPEMKVGTSQANAGAGFMELWADSSDDRTVKLGI